PPKPEVPKAKKRRRKKEPVVSESPVAHPVSASTPAPAPSPVMAPLAPAPTQEFMDPAPTPTVASLNDLVPMQLPGATGGQDTPQKVKVCSFYNKKKGCATGALCPYLHRGNAMRGRRFTRGHGTPASPDNCPVIHTNLNEAPTAADTALPAAAAELAPQPQHVEKRPRIDIVENAVLPPIQAPLPVTMAPLPFAAAPVQAPVPAPMLPPPLVPGTAREMIKSTSGVIKGAHDSDEEESTSSLLAGLPVSSFVKPVPEKVTKTTVTSPRVKESTEYPHPRADEWQDLVERTQAHSRYKSTYSFNVDSTWIEAQKCSNKCKDLPQVIALDCEMCMSEDPVSKKRNGKELVRLSIVDGTDGKRLLDTLVRPTNPVIEWRSDIHGVKADHVTECTFSHRHAQAAMARLCCKHTVIIGHALNNDLEALKVHLVLTF
ncbi:unnamed protein product, partial [Choristocarpus tenellus]